MQPPLTIYNTLSREKVLFSPLNPPLVGMYVCGPTVYSNVHLGNCRTFTTFDVVYRYLQYLGYKVRYVRNITDVGHLINDNDDGEDKIAKKARLEKLEPMEVVQQYTTDFHRVMDMLNNQTPSIEPSATGHILEQIQMIETLLQKGLAYEVNGSVYFDVTTYHKHNYYGKLSGRKLEELMAGFRALDGQNDKRNNIDFALWKKATKGHIMKWDSPWSLGFPGWHLECSAMSAKYLGTQFDIHGGGMDLKFPHHECEIAQGVGIYGKQPVKYWMHTNMLTLNGARMGKSVGNAILPQELFSGTHTLLQKAYSPMTFRFFVLQAHYGSTLDMSAVALAAAEKGYKKIINGLRVAKASIYQPNLQTTVNEQLAEKITIIINAIHRSMNDDFNTALALAHLFNLLKIINATHTGQIQSAQLSQHLFDNVMHTYITFVQDVLGLVEEKPNPMLAIKMLVELYKEAKAIKDFDKVDRLRKQFKQMGLAMKDMKDGVEWIYTEV